MHQRLVVTREQHPMRPFRTWQFIQGGDALATAVEVAGPGSDAAQRLATAMSREMARLFVTIEDGDTRVRVAAAAAVAAWVLPETRALANDVIARWLAAGIGGPARMTDPRNIFSRALLALVRNDAEDAVRCLEALQKFPSFPHTGALHDLVVARVQWHGGDRESACLRNLLFVCRDEPLLRALAGLCQATPTPVSRRRTPRTSWAPARSWPVDLLEG